MDAGAFTGEFAGENGIFPRVGLLRFDAELFRQFEVPTYFALDRFYGPVREFRLRNSI
jgi:hypothetical protein